MPSTRGGPGCPVDEDVLWGVKIVTESQNEECFKSRSSLREWTSCKKNLNGQWSRFPVAAEVKPFPGGSINALVSTCST